MALDNIQQQTDLQVALSRQNIHELPILSILPSKPKVGKLYYFERIILPNITAVGYWGYKPTGWVLLG